VITAEKAFSASGGGRYHGSTSLVSRSPPKRSFTRAAVSSVMASLPPRDSPRDGDRSRGRPGQSVPTTGPRAPTLDVARVQWPASMSSPPIAFRSVDDAGGLLRASPAWWSRPRLAAWTAGRDLVGWILWGHVDEEDAEAGKRVWIALAGAMAPGYDFVLDLR